MNLLKFEKYSLKRHKEAYLEFAAIFSFSMWLYTSSFVSELV